MKVAVIGAGLAGLITAYRLLQNEIDVHLYEAHNRPGGRVFTVKSGGRISELGGYSITDGGEASHLRRLIEEFKFELETTSLRLDYSYFDGKNLIPVQDLLKNRHFEPKVLWDQLTYLAKNSQNMGEVLNSLFPGEQTIRDALSVRLAAYEGANIEQLSSQYVGTLYHMLLGGVSSVHPSNGQEEAAISLSRIQGGNALLPEKIAESLDQRIHLNKPLAKIAKQSKQSYLLTFQDGEEVEAENVVLAIPCPAYKTILFADQTIPADKLRAIENITYGTNSKIVVPLSHCNPETRTLINDHVICFFDAQQGLLTLYYTGTSGAFSENSIAQSLANEKELIALHDCNSALPLPPPDYARDSSFSSYHGPVGYSWTNDPYIGGSYSCIAPGQEKLMTETKEEMGELVRALFAPIDQTLFFAGEHTSTLFDAGGTMEAACESGERTARILLKTLNS